MLLNRTVAAGASALVALLALSACGTRVDLGTAGANLGASADDGLGLGTTAPTQSATASATPGLTGSSSAPSDAPLDPTATPSDVVVPGVGTGPTASSSKPIQIGVVLTNTSSAASSGFSSGESLSEQQIDQALITAINKKGGILGRQLQPVFSMTDPSSNDWATDFAAVCANFTEDHHVQAVLGYVFNYDPAFEACLAKRGVPHLSTAMNVPDKIELAHSPMLRNLSVPTIDKRSLSKIQGAIKDGWLTTKSVLGVLVDDCPGVRRSYDTVAKPYLASRGIKVAVEVGGGCSNSGTDVSAASSAAGTIIKLRQAGVDTLMFLATAEGPVLAIAAIAAEAQGWHPTYIMSSIGNLSALEGQVHPDQMAKVKGYGWMPGQDVGLAHQPKKSAGQLRCLSLLQSVGVKPVSFGDLNNAYRICTGVFAYEAALMKNGASTEGRSVIAALDSLGTSFSDPDVLDGATVFGKGHENAAPAYYRAVVWNGSCKCFNYSGPMRQMP